MYYNNLTFFLQIIRPYHPEISNLFQIDIQNVHELQELLTIYLVFNLLLKNYDSRGWILLIDLSKDCLKCILLHKRKKLCSLSGAHSFIFKEEKINQLQKTQYI